MKLLLAILALTLTPPDERTGLMRDECSSIEINALYDDAGREVFTQAIFREATETGEQVRAWRLVKSTTVMPQKNWRTGRYEMLWHDGDTLRRIEARAVRYTFSQHDPELRERDTLPKHERRELSQLRMEFHTGE